ncbi:MAG: T9SS type A sorting domain-containing protein [Chitinophagaceae bacterium]|nr:MAG: T9SS type A sorting domain-containing protein [Chitinophagaceae bacterium]
MCARIPFYGLVLLLAFYSTSFAATITSFSPTTISAGTASLLTINGVDFGTTRGSVLFRNADNGGGSFIRASNAEIVSWNTTTIVVKVPQGAGTGQVAVTVNGTQIYSTGILTVKYAVLDGNNTTGIEPIRIVNDNGTGGYTFQMETSFDANAAAKASFNRALNSWKCSTSINWVVGPKTTVNTVATDDVNVIKFGGEGEIEAGTLGYTQSSWRRCSNGKWELRDIDMVFNTKDYSWNYTTGEPAFNQFDFETVALHELGHAHSLGHVINPADPMHYAIGYGTVNRTLSALDIEGGNFVINYSLPVLNGSCASPIVPLPSGSCNAAAPTIASFTPTNAGSTEIVTITGTNFINVLGVSFGDIAATSFTVVSPTTITAVVANGASGNVRVTTAGGIAIASGFNYNPKLAQTLLANPIPIKTYGDVDFDPGVISSAGLPVSYSSNNTLVATIINNKVHIVGAGTAVITASQAGNASYNAATSVNLNLLVNKTNQVITFAPIAAKEIMSADFDPAATASSGLALTYTSSNLSVATIIGGKIHIVGAGISTITASQAGNATIAAATPIAVQLVVNKATQSIIFPVITVKNYNDFDFDPSATASSGLAVRYTSSNPEVATIIAGKVHIVASGVTIITASQAGNSNYNAAANVSQALEVVFTLPLSNFSIKTTDETCKSSNNGSINIVAAQNLNYIAAVMVNDAAVLYPFTSGLTINNLQAGTYTVCITVPGQPNYKQCFNLVIKEPKDLAVYSSIKDNGNSVLLELEGSEWYKIEVNGQVITTKEQEVLIPLQKGNNNVKISSNVSCQGVITKTFLTYDGVLLYPNPVKNMLNISIGHSETKPVLVEIFALDGRLVHTSRYMAEHGLVTLDASKLNRGLYVVSLSVGNSKTVHKVVKE